MGSACSPCVFAWRVKRPRGRYWTPNGSWFWCVNVCRCIKKGVSVKCEVFWVKMSWKVHYYHIFYIYMLPSLLWWASETVIQRGSNSNTHTHIQSRSSYLHLVSFMLKAPSSCGRGWQQEVESWCFLSARWRRGRTLWRNRSFLSFTCRRWQGPRYWVPCSWSVIPFVLCSRKSVRLSRHSCVLTRSTEDPKEYFRLTLRPASTSDTHNTHL